VNVMDFKYGDHKKFENELYLLFEYISEYVYSVDNYWYWLKN